MGAFAERMLNAETPMQRYRVTFKGLHVIVTANNSQLAFIRGRNKILAMYTDMTPHESLSDIDTFKLAASVMPLGNR